MATSFKEWPWPLQALFWLGLAVALILAGLYVPGLPLTNMRAQLQTAQAEMKPLEADVQNLRVYKQRRVELQSEMDALQKQLATLQTIVPEEKQTDQFILMVQNAAVSSGVNVRKLTAKTIASKQYYFEMPFDIEADGPYYSVLEFFSRLGRLSRIINVGDLKLASVAKTGTGKFRMTPGTSVTGTFTITTFYTQAKEAAQAKPVSATVPAKR
jgi:type IV pilus assembly protein PilO